MKSLLMSHPTIFASRRSRLVARLRSGLLPAQRAIWLTLTALLIATLLGLSGCSNSKPLMLSGHKLTVTLSEYSISPQYISVPAGPLQIVAYNKGILTHNIALELSHRDSHGEPVILKDSPPILPGREATLTIILRGAHRYILASTISNQTDLGMSATLVVR
jgi:hypothetical protein